MYKRQTKDGGKTARCQVEVVHSAIKVEATEATQTQSGNIVYWHCTRCGRYFRDAALMQEIRLEDTVVPPTGKPADPAPSGTPGDAHNPGAAPPTGDPFARYLCLAMAGVLLAAGGAACAYHARRHRGAR